MISSMRGGGGWGLWQSLFSGSKSTLELEAGLPPWFHQKSPHSLETPIPAEADGAGRCWSSGA